MKMRTVFLSIVIILTLFVSGSASLAKDDQPKRADMTDTPSNRLSNEFVAPEVLACPPSIGYGDLIQCSISTAAENDIFTFAGSNHERVRIRIIETSGSLYAYQEIIRPDGTTLCGPSWGDEMTCDLDMNGTYKIIIRDYYGTGTGNYSLYLQRLNNPVGCSALTFASLPILGSISLAAEHDCYTFYGKINDVVLSTLIEINGNLYAYMELLRPDGTTLCGPTWADILNCPLDAAGKYTLLVRDYYGIETGDYYIDLQRLNNPVGCRSLTYGSPPLSGSIDLPAENDCFTFSGGEDAQIRSTVVKTNGNLYPYHVIVRPDGSTLCGPTWSDQLNCSLDVSGVHTLLVRDYYGIETGDYRVSLLCLSDDCGGSPTPSPTATRTPTPTLTTTRTKTPGPSPTPTATRTPPPGGYKHQFLPLLKRGSGYFEGPWEQEDNDSYLQANGPIRSGRDYYGYPDDQKDFYSLSMDKAGQVTVDIANHTGSGVQIQLFYQSVDNRICYDPTAPYHCEYNGQPGWYYVYIYTESGFNTDHPYTLRAAFP